MNQKQKEEWLDLFTEAFAGVVLPRLEPLEEDMKEVKEIIAHLKTHPVQRAL